MAEKEYIERDAVVRLLCKEALQEYNLQRYGEARGVVSAKESVNRFPAADVAPVVHGKWIDRDGKTWCSKCDASNKQYKPPYCPHCGAKMGSVANG